MKHEWANGELSPVYVFTLPPVMTDESFAGVIATLDEFYANLAEPFAFVVDTSHTTSFSSEHRRQLVEFDRRHQQADRVFCRGVAFVLTSALMRGVVAAWHFVLPPSYPARVFDNTPEAIGWAVKQMQVVTRGVDKKHTAWLKKQAHRIDTK